MVEEWIGRYHHPGSVSRGVTRQSLETPADIDYLFDRFIRLVKGFELCYPFEGGLQVVPVRDQLGEPVGRPIGNAEDAPHVAYNAARGHAVVGRNLRRLIAPILLLHVSDHAIAPLHAEVDVKVRHADTLRVEEPLEDQVVLQWIDTRDSDAIGDQAPRRRTASRADRDALAAGKPDEVPHDKEVRRVLHPLDNTKLVVEAILHLLR